MNDTAIVPGGSGRPMLRIPLATAGSISAVLSVAMIVIGWIGGYLTFKSEMNTVNERAIATQGSINALNERLNTMNSAVTNDRQNVTNRLTGIEAEVKYLGQGLAEIKLAILPRR